MKYNQRKASRGSVLVAAIVTAAVLAILTAGLLSYLTSESNLNYRSHRWNQAFHLAEGAIEVGVAELNYQYKQGGAGFQSADGWTSLGSNSYAKTVANLTDNRGQIIGSLKVTAVGVGTVNPQFTGVGTVTSSNFGGPDISRAIQVTVAPSSAFPIGLVSKNTINLNGNNVYTDSFDSTDPSKSTGGAYDPNKKQPHGDIATDSTVIDSIGIGNADIYGTASTGPGGTVTMGPSGSVGPTFDDSLRATTVDAGVDAGWIRNDFATDVPVPTAPTGATSWGTPALYSSGTVSSGGTITSGDYKINNISLNSHEILTISGDVTLYVTGNTSITGNGQITLLPGASLTVYSAGSISIAGNGIQNNSTYAAHDIWYGLETCPSVSIGGNGNFTGAIYAPTADLSLGVSGTGNYYGAVVAKSVTLNGNADFHYDESLKDIQGPTGYVAATWQELRLVANNWVP
jgi:hypothetical protein